MKKKLIYLIIGIIILIVFVFGVTYAAFLWASDPSGGFINGTSECFIIDYTKGEDILDGVLPLSDDYTTGLNASVKTKINDNCTTIKGLATLYVDVKEATSDYFIDNSLLRYQVLEDGEEVADGFLTEKGLNTVYTDIEITNVEKEFTVYVWLYKYDVNNDNVEYVYDSTYSIGIQMDAEGR